MRSSIHRFDSTITTAIQGWPAWLHGYMVAVSWIGQPIITLTILVITGLCCLLVGNLRLVAAVIVAGLTFGVNSLLKLVLHRDRPLGHPEMYLPTYSFPSGHAASSIVVFGLLAYIAWHTVPQPWGGVISGVLVFLIVSIGVSRIYLGAHYPTDVLVGWLIGLIGLAIIIWIVRPFA